MLNIIYSFFLGLMLSLFVGFGINTFYTAPAAPTAPTFSNVDNKVGLNDQQLAQQNAFEKTRETFDKTQMNPYNRNVSIIALGAAVLFVAIGLLLESRIGILSDGALLGGVFTLIYALGRGIAAQNSGYSFATVSIGLVIVLLLGYLRFIKPTLHTPQGLKPRHS